MKKLILGVAAAAMTLSGAAAAFAEPYGHDRGGRGGHEWNGGDHGGHDWSRGGGWNRGGEYRAGGYFGGYRDHDRMVDWRAYHLPRPRDGYAYYRDDDGDIVMAALASGLIGMVMGQDIYGPGYGYADPYSYPAPYGYAQPYAYGYPPAYGYGYGYPY